MVTNQVTETFTFLNSTHLFREKWKTDESESPPIYFVSVIRCRTSVQKCKCDSAISKATKERPQLAESSWGCVEKSSRLVHHSLCLLRPPKKKKKFQSFFFIIIKSLSSSFFLSELSFSIGSYWVSWFPIKRARENWVCFLTTYFAP